jgi:hypothetical protein
MGRFVDLVGNMRSWVEACDIGFYRWRVLADDEVRDWLRWGCVVGRGWGYDDVTRAIQTVLGSKRAFNEVSRRKLVNGDELLLVQPCFVGQHVGNDKLVWFLHSLTHCAPSKGKYA